ncbi:MAG: tetratricopeptide repeat protein [Algisphaera sp.]
MPLEPATHEPDDTRRRVGVLIQTGRFELAEGELVKHLAGAPDDGWALATLALCKQQSGRPDEAREIAQSAVAADPESGWARYVLGLSIANDPDAPEGGGKPSRWLPWSGTHDHKRLQAALEYLEAAVSLDPDEPGYRFAVAQLHDTLDDAPAAVRVLREALAIDPAHAESAAMLTRLLREHGRLDRAELASRLALAQNPDDENIHEQRGWLALRRGEHTASAEHFAAALRERPTAVGPRHGLQAALLAARPGLNQVVRVGEWWRAELARPGRLSVWLTLALLLGVAAGGWLGLHTWLPTNRTRPSVIDGYVVGGAMAVGAALLAVAFPFVVQAIALLVLRRDAQGGYLVSGGQLLMGWFWVCAGVWCAAVLGSGLAQGFGSTNTQWAWVAGVMVTPLACALSADRDRHVAAWCVVGVACMAVGWMGMQLLPLNNARGALVPVALAFAGAVAGMIASRRAVG